MSLSVRGALTNWPKRMFKNMLQHNDGRSMSADEARATLLDELSKGHEVIPCADCDNFDFKKGCQGHPDKATEVPA